MTAAVDKASLKLTATIGKKCGGADQICGGDLVNEDHPVTFGWPSSCPDFARTGCVDALTTCGDVASCLACVDGAVPGLVTHLAYDSLLPDGGNNALRKCQLSIGKASAAFLRAKSKALQKCRAAASITISLARAGGA